MLSCCLKVDVDTHDGMRAVPQLLDTFREFGVRATFFLSFGPDNAGKAIWNVFRTKGFLKKMLRTGAPKLYGWRTVLSGTLLPARPIATAFPDLVLRIHNEGHEVAVHAWDHRLWQDHLDELSRSEIEEQFARAFDAFEQMLHRRPAAVGAPAWRVSVESLKVQDSLGLLYASDFRGGQPGYPELEGYRSTTLQIPTTQPCLEELLTQGERDLERCVEKVLKPHGEVETLIIPLHAEVEGGPYNNFLRMLLERIRQAEMPVLLLREKAEALRSSSERLPVLQVSLREIPGRAGTVALSEP